MNHATDQQLLADYDRHRSEPAFAELVRRHVDFVYSAAVRLVCDPHLAQDVTQSVFVALARQAPQLTDRPVLSGWLHRTAQNLAANAVRAEVRRRQREQEAATMNDLIAPDATWADIAPQLEAALGQLPEPDRDALLLRYFERKSAREMAQILAISDEAAQKRVSRAVDRLRDYFASRKVTVGAGGLVVLISAHAVQAAPAGLAATITAAAVLAGTTTASTTAIIAAATQTIAMTTLQKTLVAVTVAALAGASLYEARQAAQLRAQNQALQQQLAGQTRQSAESQADATNRLAALIAENKRLKSDTLAQEVLKLRGQVAVLQNAPTDPGEQVVKNVAAKVRTLKQILAQRPGQQIPELEFVTDKVWADIAWNADLDTEDGIRVALSNLRGEAENIFLNEMLHAALKKYLAANNNLLPASLLDLKSYFTVSVTDAMLGRYELLQTGEPTKTGSLVKLAVYADEDYDSFHQISLNGASGGGFNHNQDAINDAAREYARANNYQSPTTPAQIAPYLHKTIDPVTIQKYLSQFVMDPPSAEEVTLAPVIHAYLAAHNGVRPNQPSDLLPYLTTPEQQAAYQKLEPPNPPAK